AKSLALRPANDPNREWVQGRLDHCKRLAALAPRFPKLLAGDETPASAEEAATAAELCWMGPKKYYLAAAGVYRTALRLAGGLAARGAEPRRNRHRYNAACAAVLAAAGVGEDARDLSPEDRAKWRGRALNWLQGELEAWRNRRDDARSRPEIARTLQYWKA